VDVATIKDLTGRNAVERGDTPFLLFHGDTITYGQLEKRSDACAAYLSSRGVKRGDVVAFMMGNSPEFFYVLLGAQKIGAIAGPISCWWQAKEVEFLVNDCQAPVLIMDAQYEPIVSSIRGRIPSVRRTVFNAGSPFQVSYPHELLSDILHGAGARLSDAPPGTDDVAAVMYTSGTTGQPKGVLLSHKGILAGCRSKLANVPVEPEERILCVLPLFHSGGLNDLAFPCMYAGATIVLRRSFSASEFWQCVERHRVNAFYIVPTMWNILLKAPEALNVDTSSLRLGLSGAAPIPPEQLRECEERFHVPIIEAYGQTENSGGITANTLKQRKTGSVGTALPGVEVEIRNDNDRSLPAGEIGEIVVRGDTVMKGYLNAPEATASTIRDGWLRTGDVGYLDDQGFLFIVDRIKDLIIRGGVNVYPKEIEHVIAGHTAVDQVAVIPEAHEKYGQVAKACVVVKRGSSLNEAELRRFCEENMASYKVPEAFLFRAKLPTNAIGKVVKKDLIRELAEEATAEAVPVAHLFEGMPARFLGEKAKGVEAVISYRITGGGGGDWTVTIRDGRMTLARGIAEAPRVYIVAQDRDYHDIATGKLDGVTALVTGKVKIEGDVGFMAELSQMMKPVGS
jgi:long-chain acyl-CoA synthetase